METGRSMFYASLGYRMRPCLKKNKTQTKRKRKVKEIGYRNRLKRKQAGNGGGQRSAQPRTLEPVLCISRQAHVKDKLQVPWRQSGFAREEAGIKAAGAKGSTG